MKIMIRLFVILFLLTCPVAHADQAIDDDLKIAESYINEYSINNGQVDPIGLVSLWQEMEGLKTLAFLYYKNALPEQMAIELHKRAALLPKNLSNIIDDNDKTVRSLARLLLLNEKFLSKFISGIIDYYVYSDVANYTINYGRVLAEEVEKKYSKGKKIIKAEKETNW